MKLKISVTDSGEGFIYLNEEESLKVSNQPWGRGISLVKSLSEKVTYSEKGNSVEVIVNLN